MPIILPPPSAASSPMTALRTRLKSIVQAQFTDLANLIVVDDRLHGSLGQGRPYCGTFPLNEVEQSDNANVLLLNAAVQFFNSFDPQINPDQRVDPAIIEGYADRFRKTCKLNSEINADNLWYFELVSIDYPPDPTGNITRFLAVVQAYGSNAANV